MDVKLSIGIDIGSTTVKLSVADCEEARVIEDCYVRHHARQAATLRERLELPRSPETMVAFGCALAGRKLFAGKSEPLTIGEVLERLDRAEAAMNLADAGSAEPFFRTAREREAFELRHGAEQLPFARPEAEDGELPVYIGIDSGSTTSKIVLLDRSERVIDSFYAGNEGSSLEVVRRGLGLLCDKYLKQGIRLRPLAVGATGYGEEMTAAAIGADYHIVETVAHAAACMKYYPDASFMLDMLLEISRKTRPYELVPGATDEALKKAVDLVAAGIQKGIGQARKAFDEGLAVLAAVPYDRSEPKPRVFVTGELLVTYHEGSNFHIEKYLENNGMETIFPRITDQLRKDFLASSDEIREFKADIPRYPILITKLFDFIQDKLEKQALKHPLFERGLKPAEAYRGVSDIIPMSLSCGEGWLMAAEINHYAEQGVRAAVILQPFGCLPNHVCGRGVIKSLKDRHPGIMILPLDLDPDTSYANVENRLQMLIMNQCETVNN